MTHLLDEAVDALERKIFFAAMTDRFDELRADPQAWAEVDSERAVEGGVLADRSV